MSTFLLTAVLCLTGCGDDGTTDSAITDSPTDSVPATGDTQETGSEPLDVDGDGFGDDVDCNDADPASYPGAEEICDDDDNDCDGETDEGVSVPIYPDDDGDGFGDPDRAVDGCNAQAGETLIGDDCDDEDSESYPGASERCDDADNDCDGSVDEELTQEWYADSDGDGYGNAEFSITSCDPGSGWADNGDDCDDTSNQAWPDGIELCDGLDNDCDGLWDDQDPDVIGLTTWYADADGDGYGATAYTVETCELPSGYAEVDGDCDDSDAAFNPGALEEDCADPSDYNCDGSVGYADADADGFAACEDCDDADAAVSPHATELCDGADNDCDGDTDEAEAWDAATWYADTDGDGYGSADSTQVACDAPSGFVDNTDDCDDGDAAVNPGAAEVCDGADQDCDGTVDEDASDGDTFYVDADGDGHGSSAYSTTGCDAPSGFVDNTDDCNDGDASVSPDASETCDGADQDCDGTVDNDPTDPETFYADSDGDGYGDPDTTSQACEAPSGTVDNADDCDDGDGAIHPGAGETCDSGDEDCDGLIDDDDPDLAGATSTFYADLDGDGYGTSAYTATACSAPSGFVDNTDDCNDGDATVSPAGTETCDGTDEDCDGSTDEDPSDPDIFYADDDGDGYGDPDSTTEACEAASGTVDNDDDCDDSDSGISPDAAESCDAGDEDCDGLEDEDDPDLRGSLTDYYIDHDGDGHGSSDYTLAACDVPSGYVTDGDDCDDLDASASPSGVEVCDGVDNDCDGETDGVDAIDAVTWYTDDDGDSYGDATRSSLSCSAPTGTVEDGSDCDDADAAVNPGATEICNSGVDDDCDGDADDDDTSLDGTTATTWYVDADGDGYGDASSSTTDACEEPSGHADNADDCNDSDASSSTTCVDGLTQSEAGTTCATLLADAPSASDGTYWIDPDDDGDTSDAFEVYCDMSGGGWAYASAGTPFALAYTGGTQSLETPGVTTTYLFTAYGAAAGQGHNAAGNSCGSGSETGGHGGSATGSVSLAASTTLYVEVGGQGDDGTCADQGSYDLNTGGYNGGGRGSQGGSAGGGGTDVRLTDGDLNSRILVAGGGGGCGSESCIYGGGHGGGETGGTSGTGGTGGTQSAGGSSGTGSGTGSFGVGADNTQGNDEGGGGGGWYGGASGGTANYAGSGGSAYTGGMDADQDTHTGVNSGDGYVEYVFQ